MQRQLEASHDNVIGYSLAGDVSAEEYQQVTSELRDAITRFGTIRILFRLSDLSLGSFFNALDERFRFLRDNAEVIERIAVVSDDTATDLLSSLTDAATPIDTRHFSRADEDQAWAWLE
jgi:hypothetical protein